MRRVGVLGLALVLAACGQETTSPSASAEAFDLPADNVGIGTRTTMLSDGVVTAILLSDTSFIYEDGRPLDLMGVDVTFYTEQGVEAGTLTSRTGEYDMSTGLFIARGNVVLIAQGAEGPRQLETEELHYDVRGDELWTDSPFTMVEAGRTTTGTSFRSDSKFQTWEVTGAQSQGTVSGDGGIRF